MLGLLKFVQKCKFNTYSKSSFARLIFPKRYFSQKPLDVSTNVTKDVILYKCDNDKFFKIINIFALCQFSFWTYLSLFGFNNLKDIPVDPSEDKWWRKINLGEKKYRIALTTVSFLIGWGILGITWIYSIRSVKYLILRKGGNDVTLITFTPLGPNRMLTVSLNNLNCKESRTSAKSQLPIKIKGHYLHYMLDSRGQFKNPILFDHTAGLKRKLS